MIEWLRHTSQAIKGFPMGDPHEREFPIYLPPGYDSKRKEPYPVIFMLAGFSGKGAHYIVDDRAFGKSLPQRFDEAMTAGRMKPAILVFPDCTSKYGCSQYVNSPAFGNYMDYLCDELTTFIDSKFHTHRSASYRAVAGHSSGGFGSIITGMLRPDAFKYLCSSAGDGYYEISFLSTIPAVIAEVESAGSVEKFLDKFLNLPNPNSAGGKKFDAMLTLAMAPCYAPNLKNPPLYGDLFFELKNGKIIPEIWQKYLDWDPVRMVHKNIPALQSLKWIHLESGSQDEHGLHLVHRQLAETFKAQGISHSIEEYPGGHSGHHWRFESRLTLLLNHMYENK